MDLNRIITTSYGDLVAFFIWIASVGVGKMNVATGFRHNPTNGVASLSNDVRVISVRNVHFHRHTTCLSVQMLHNHCLGKRDTFLRTTDANMGIYNARIMQA